MLSISIGPWALPVAPLVLLVAVWLAAALARWMAGPADGARAENALWIATALGLLAARVGHVVGHADAYLASPWAMLDVRDGGWFAPAGLLVGGLWLVRRAWAPTPLRRALSLATLAGAAVWTAGSTAAFFAGGGWSSTVPPLCC